MPLSTKTLEQMINDLVAGWAAKVGLSPSLISGDPLLAVMQAVGSQANFLQWLCQQVLLFARASTAEGVDLDSWMADFQFTRLAATKAQGQVRFSLKAAKATNVVIPAGKIIQTAGGAIQYEIIGDSLQSAWSEDQQAYIIPAGSTMVMGTVRALTAGYAYNVQSDQLVQINSTITGLDDVTNLVAITNGLDAETDESFRTRFILWINSLSKNTRPAILAAVMSVQQGLNISLVENTDQNGDERIGFFTVVIDDGSGDPSQDLLDAIYTAVDQVRGFTIAFTVVAATKVTPTVELNIKVLDGVTVQPIQDKVQDAIINYINSLKIGESLYLYKLIEIAIQADANVLTVQPNSVLINNDEDDLEATAFEVFRVEPSDVSVSHY